MPPHDLQRVQVHSGELGVVVEHPLKVRNRPPRVHAVAVKPAAKLVVNAALRHLLEREQGQFQNAPVSGAFEVLQHELEGGGRGEFGSVAKAAVLRVKTGGQVFHRSSAKSGV